MRQRRRQLESGHARPAAPHRPTRAPPTARRLTAPHRPARPHGRRGARRPDDHDRRAGLRRERDPGRDLRTGARERRVSGRRSRRSAASATSCSPRSSRVTSTSPPSTPRRRSSSSTATPARRPVTSTRPSPCCRPNSNPRASPRSRRRRRSTRTRSSSPPRQRRNSGLENVSDLTADLTLGGPPDCPDNAVCAARPRVRPTTSTCRRSFVPLDGGGPLTVAALEEGEIDVAILFSTNGIIADKGWVVLDDDQGLINADNIMPVAVAGTHRCLWRRLAGARRRDQRGVDHRGTHRPQPAGRHRTRGRRRGRHSTG